MAVPAPVLEEDVDGDVDPFLDDRPVRSSVDHGMNAKNMNASVSEEEDEGPADGSQFFPGSGFF